MGIGTSGRHLHQQHLIRIRGHDEVRHPSRFTKLLGLLLFRKVGPADACQQFIAMFIISGCIQARALPHYESVGLDVGKSVS